MFYRIKVDSQYPSEYTNIIMIYKVYGNNKTSKLTYNSVSDYEYTGSGTGCFNNSGIIWQTNRWVGYPHYMIFESDAKLNNIIIQSGDGVSYNIKNFSIAESITKLSFTDNNWKTIFEGVAENRHDEQSFIINLCLIYKNNMYYNIDDDNYDIDNKIYLPISRNQDQTITDFYRLNNVDISNLFIEKNISDETFKPIDKFDNFHIKLRLEV